MFVEDPYIDANRMAFETESSISIQPTIYGVYIAEYWTERIVNQGTIP